MLRKRSFFNIHRILILMILGSVSSIRIVYAGYTDVTHSFEVISHALTQDLEESYEMFFLINSAEGPTKIGALIPNQHMLVVKKKKDNKHIFIRDNKGTIIGLNSGAEQLSQFIPPHILANSSNNSFGFPFDWNGLEVLPISTGTLYHMPTFSGIFQLNWNRSQSRYVRDETQPMSHSLYVGYYYHNRNQPESQWTEDTREQVSYVAIHGTPIENWQILGRSRASHGCARVRAPIMHSLYEAVEMLPLKNIIELDWDYELPQSDRSLGTKKQKPVLFLIFNGY